MTYTDERVDCEEGARGKEGGPMFAIYLTIGPVENNAALRQACHGRRAGADGGGGVQAMKKIAPSSLERECIDCKCGHALSMDDRKAQAYLPTYLIT